MSSGRELRLDRMADAAAPGPGFRIWGPLRREDLPGLTERVCGVLAVHAGSPLLCDVEDVAADAVAVEALARLQLAARRAGCRITMRAAAPELVELIGLLGLQDVLPAEPQDVGASGVEPER
jgi:ABC-type transporter Mla MlaB component